MTYNLSNDCGQSLFAFGAGALEESDFASDFVEPFDSFEEGFEAGLDSLVSVFAFL